MNIDGIESKLYQMLQNSTFDLGFFHPYIVDFAVVLPLLALFFHFVAILTAGAEQSNRGLQVAANLLFFGSFVAIIFAYLTGLGQSREIFDMLPKLGQATYHSHTTLAIFLLFGFLILLVVKSISMLVKKNAVRYLFGTLFFFMILLLVYQWVLGIQLVYDYGAGVSIVQ